MHNLFISKVILIIIAPVVLFQSGGQPLPPLPSDLPGQIAPRQPIVRETLIPQRQFTLPRLVRPMPVATAQIPAATAPSIVDKVLAWDAILKEFTAEAGDTNALFTFAVTNIASSNVVINWVRPSCGCTVAKIPPTPWTLTPGETGALEFSLDLRGKRGTLYKYISVDTSVGQKMLNIRATIPEEARIAGTDTRVRNMQLAMVDRQIVFRGDCASCHATPLAGKTEGEHIYQAGCAICHDTPNRATMVPDLQTVANPGTKEYWELWIRHGKAGTLMPAFAQVHGGPMTEEQIATLSAYLSKKIPARSTPVATLTNSIPMRRITAPNSAPVPVTN
jgi:mono/diheme cytochrome c family protein